MTAPPTIYALSSGAPPAAIAIIRISGERALTALSQLGVERVMPRQAQLARLHDPITKEQLDQGLVLHFPAGRSVTGEDLVELHLHGGRAVVGGVMTALGKVAGLRLAEPGEFTRRSFENGRIDLAQAEGLADLLAAETEAQRRAALSVAEGGVSRAVDQIRTRLLDLSARVEAMIDHADEGDVSGDLSWQDDATALAETIQTHLSAPSSERLRHGVRTVIAGPPNAGKSSLFNAIVGREAALVSAEAGTTRDVIEAPLNIRGIPFLLMDTAGLREATGVEAQGIGRARLLLQSSDIVIWLGDHGDRPDHPSVVSVTSKSDLIQGQCPEGELLVSATTGAGLNSLSRELVARANTLLPREDQLSLSLSQQSALEGAHADLVDAVQCRDILVRAELLRLARAALDRITGRAGVEDMLDALFGRFCIGK